MLERKKRLKELLAKLDIASPKHINIKNRILKKTGTYLFMKHRERVGLINKMHVFNYTINPVTNKKYIFTLRDYSILRRNKLTNEILLSEDLVFSPKTSQTTVNQNKVRNEKLRKFLKSKIKYSKFSKINMLTKINLIQRAALKNISKCLFHTREYRLINTKNLLSKVSKQVTYKLK
jgi:hypothetical protein